MSSYPKGSLNKFIFSIFFDRAQDGIRTFDKNLLTTAGGLYQKSQVLLVPKYPSNIHKQQGFSIIMAIFILVVLGLLGGYMVRLSGVQHTTSILALQGARAYQAAKAGLGWSIAKISTGGTCADVNAQTALTIPDMTGFSVKLTCSLLSYQEGSDTFGIYQINAHSEFGAFGGADYVSRELEVSIVK